MTLKTLTGPSIREALADARRLFGADVVLLQSAPAAHGEPATVTVGFDAAPPVRRPAPARPAAPPAVPDLSAEAPPRVYGYAAARKGVPAPAERLSAPPPAAETPAAPAPTISPLVLPVVERTAAPGPVPPAGALTSATEVDSLRARLAEVEERLAALQRTAPAPLPSRPPVVFVGPAGSGKTSLALRLAQAPHLVGASTPAALVVAPEADRVADPAPLFWAAGVPVAVVRTAADVAEALRQFEDADLIVVDTPALPLSPEAAAPVVARLGTLLAPLGAVEVWLAVDATRAAATLTAERLAATGLRPDALALTRLDEVGGPACPAADAWAHALGLPLRLVADGPAAEDLARPLPPPLPPPLPVWGPIPADRPAPPVAVCPDLASLVSSSIAAMPPGTPVLA